MIILQGEKQKELEEALLSGKEDGLEVKLVNHFSTEKNHFSCKVFSITEGTTIKVNLFRISEHIWCKVAEYKCSTNLRDC